jgi:hypothetical protein
VRDTRPIHFFTDDATAVAVTDWDPDIEPERFASGAGHNLIELYVRLARRGLTLTIGRAIPRESGLVVYYHHAWARRAEIHLAMRAAPYRTAVIRSDAPLWWESLLPADLVIVPNGNPVWSERYGARGVHLPALPQRGLLPRTPGRQGIRTVAFKGNPGSVPAYLRDPNFLAELHARGITLMLDVPNETDGSDQRWHDFSDVDVVLCLRGAAPDDSLLNKPATRLINAWSAGVIPLVSSEPAYLELITHGLDGLVIEGPVGILEALDQLAANVDRSERMYRTCRERGMDFRVEELLCAWATMLERASADRFPLGLTTVRRYVVLKNLASRVKRSTLNHVVNMVARKA